MCRLEFPSPPPLPHLPVPEPFLTYPYIVRDIPDLDQETWENLDAEFNQIQAPLHQLLGMDEIASVFPAAD